MTSERVEDEGSVLNRIVMNRKAEIEERLPKRSNQFLEIFGDRSWPAVIAEIKPKSPSGGNLYQGDIGQLIDYYIQGGASAISVLTEKKHFGGSIDLFEEVRMRTTYPLLQKDFIFDARQLVESKEIGADAVLIILTTLLREGVNPWLMIKIAEALNVCPVVEVKDLEELTVALEAQAPVIGVNARNLDDLNENMDEALEVLERIPQDRVGLLFSSIKDRDDIERAHQAGAKGVLVGTSLRAEDPLAKLQELTSRI